MTTTDADRRTANSDSLVIIASYAPRRAQRSGDCLSLSGHNKRSSLIEAQEISTNHSAPTPITGKPPIHALVGYQRRAPHDGN